MNAHLLIAVAAASMLAAKSSVPAVFVRTVETETEKAVAVMSDPRFEDHVPRPVSEQGVARALRNAGVFNEEDVQALAAPLAAEFPNMDRREQIRILEWASDGIRRYYAWLQVPPGKTQPWLVVASYREQVQLDRHKALVPDVGAVTEVRTPVATPVETVTTEPVRMVTPTPVLAVASPTGTATTTAVAIVSPAATTTPTAIAVVARTATPRPTSLALITESEARGKLAELRTLHDKGLISRDEYKKKVKDTLNRVL